ncbi:MAG: TIM-barrel domain-containing protein [Candidatus Heimdallarchaeota archaeon]
MAKDRTTFASQLNARIIRGILNITVPILNYKRKPLRWTSIGGIVSSKSLGDRVLIECERGFLEIKIITSTIWRVRASKERLPEEHISFAAEEPKSSLQLKLSKQYGLLQIKQDKNISTREEIVIKVQERDSIISFECVDGSILTKDKQPISWSKKGSWGRIIKTGASFEYHLGFGEKTGKLLKNGEKMLFWNIDPTGYDTKEDPLYQNEPFQISIKENGKAYAIFYDNPGFSIIQLSKLEDGTVSYFTENEPLCYYIFTGPTLKDLSKQIAQLNDLLPFPPRWVLGYHQCRWSYYPENKVRELAREFRERRIPCDSIHLDIDYMNGYRVFTWDSTRFPQPAKLLQDLRNAGFKTIVMTDPGLKVDPDWQIYQECLENKYYCSLPSGEPFIGEVWPGNCIFPDFFDPKVQEWWGALYQSYLDVGVEGFWLDMAEPSIFSVRRTFPSNVLHTINGKKIPNRKVHNAYGNMFAKATREGLDKLRGEQRTFIFARTAYSGIQRYAATWTGDNASRWSSLRQSIPMILNMGITGQPFVAVDLGGFAFDTTPELLTRWYQLGIFYPFCRNHSAKGTAFQEPWVFGEKYETIIRKTLELRYQLLPYLYTLLWKASTTGLPMIRPLFMEFPKDKETLNAKWHNSQFFVGSNLLIAPILTASGNNGKLATREIYLPKGTQWIDFWSAEEFQGGQILVREVPLETVPLFVRKGAVLPMGSAVPFVEKTSEHPLSLYVYPASEISGEVYLDDGITKAFEKGNYTHLLIRGATEPRKLALEIFKDGKLEGLPTTNNELQIVVITEKIPKEIKVNDRLVKKISENQQLSWKNLEEKKGFTIMIPNPDFPLELEVKYQ